ncbi:phosphotransferase [Tritonibacter mobilis]|uniref:Hydroxylysine kinase n=1 Tax=Tritonibacter mobilis F1926 TaxID=1265309 RepID=A0A1B1A6M2_9RHOB|nr:phosphotransferase [Tritonibacter mobilis]ANP42203.1 aminoglycoside phosphotransferase [Tritonibacter mobilis F1926]KJZ22305.1 aminoglycoside phosphotransferase [Tritonibacter mobilis]
MSDAGLIPRNGLPPFLSGVLHEEASPKTDLLAQDPPAFDCALAAETALRSYGLSGAIKPLSAEKDANFLITLPTGERALLKITNAAEERTVTDMQTAALMHLAATDPTLPVQRICASLNGKAAEIVTASDGQSHVVRLMSYLEGTTLSHATPGPNLYSALGNFHARVTLGLRGFFHAGGNHFLQWDIKRARHLRPLLTDIRDINLRAQLERRLDHFEAEIAPLLPRLRAQIVHNDFNPHNILVDAPHATYPVGLIDFGDMVHTPIACDLAVACSYQIGSGTDPLRAICEMVSGYTNCLQLEPEEIALLPSLIRLRHTTTLAIGASRARRYPANAPYILRNADAAQRGLATLDQIGDATVINALKRAAAI